MKPKQFTKRLELKKETIATLDSDQLNGIRGGISRTCGTHFCKTEELTCATCMKTECACSINYCGSLPVSDCCP